MFLYGCLEINAVVSDTSDRICSQSLQTSITVAKASSAFAAACDCPEYFGYLIITASSTPTSNEGQKKKTHIKFNRKTLIIKCLERNEELECSDGTFNNGY
jgi:hypothetical protein